MNNNINWMLISLISSTLDQLIEQSHWDLDDYEFSILLKSFYEGFVNYQKSTKEEDQKMSLHEKVTAHTSDIKHIVNVVENARINCWGEDHTCNLLTRRELKIIYNTLLEDDSWKTND